MSVPDFNAEWLEADGLGGFASGTVGGVRSRRYHALLCPALKPPAGRMVLINGIEAEVITNEGVFAISAQSYAGGVIQPDGQSRLVKFGSHPWPSWQWQIGTLGVIEQQFFLVHGTGEALLLWRWLGKETTLLQLRVRLLHSGRDFHALHFENEHFQFEHAEKDKVLQWQPYAGGPCVEVAANATFEPLPWWYRKFHYAEEAARGFDASEDLASPGTFVYDLTQGDGHMIMARSEESSGRVVGASGSDSSVVFRALFERESNRRSAFISPLHHAADCYLVKRGNGQTIIAGYPWFGDWGRDTFIAMRGLCLATGNGSAARAILHEWAQVVEGGMLPNRFPDTGEAPEYHSVDAALWYAVAVHDYLEQYEDDNAGNLTNAVEAILRGYATGTRHMIKMDATDGLLACGVPGLQLTWMDAKIGDWVVTPRIGKPVEIQALWINALRIAGRWNPAWKKLAEQAEASFRARFWNSENGGHYDVIDVAHVPGKVDASIRPNQIFAIGGLPFTLLDGAMASSVVQLVEAHLLTPLGLRTLSPQDLAYVPRYEGGPRQRDGSYHQGTAWPWLLGPFIEAWIRVHGNTDETKALAKTRFLPALEAHLNLTGLQHISEIADAAAPHTARGCPFQAWSLGELLRIHEITSIRPESTPPAHSPSSAIRIVSRRSSVGSRGRASHAGVEDLVGEG